jgi:hypothetical protein
MEDSMKAKRIPANDHAHHEPIRHPRAVPTLAAVESPADIPDLDADLRYRMISEAAYHRYLNRGCIDGFDVDDWLAAEGDLDRELQAATRITAT